jgi:ATP-dependent metalloprotease FtsH
MLKKEMQKNKNTPPGGNKPGMKNGMNPKKGFNFYWIYALIILFFLGLTFFNNQKPLEETTFYDLEHKMLKTGDVERIVIVNQEFAEIFIVKDSLYKPFYEDVKGKAYGDGLNPGPHFKHVFVEQKTFVERLNAIHDQMVSADTVGLSESEAKEVLQRRPVRIEVEKRRNWTGDLMGYMVPILILIVIWIFIMRMMSRGAGGGQMFNIGKSRAQLFDKDTHVTVNFKDVAGLEEAKVEIMEIVDFLKNPKKYTDLGGKIPKGALLVGPPGTGKTLLAKAVAGEAKVPFFSLSGSDFVEMFVGVGASRVRDLFKTAKEKSPCIIFIDEIDAIGRARGKNAMTGANDERENTLNQLLTEMDGFSSNQGVIILAATNRADVLDRALLRAGRFDRQIHVELPDLNERRAIFAVHMKDLKINKNEVDQEFLAKQTPGFSGADIANVCNEAALIAARKNKKIIGKQDFLDAIDRIVGGLEKRSKIISKHEKKVIAYHEAGHATVSWMLEHASPLIKVTIIPRGRALGAAWYLPEERQITTLEQMLDEMTATLGGRAAEDIVFGKVSTGALNDLEKVTKQAFAIVSYFGLNKKIGNISYYDSSGQSEFNFTKPYSEDTAKTIDQEIRKLVEESYSNAKKILGEHKEGLSKLAKVLLEKEVIFGEDLESIFGPRKFTNEEHTITENDVVETDDGDEEQQNKNEKAD